MSAAALSVPLSVLLAATAPAAAPGPGTVEVLLVQPATGDGAFADAVAEALSDIQFTPMPLHDHGRYIAEVSVARESRGVVLSRVPAEHPSAQVGNWGGCGQRAHRNAQDPTSGPVGRHAHRPADHPRRAPAGLERRGAYRRRGPAGHGQPAGPCRPRVIPGNVGNYGHRPLESGHRTATGSRASATADEALSFSCSKAAAVIVRLFLRAAVS